jgi:hypothetical protein
MKKNCRNTALVLMGIVMLTCTWIPFAVPYKISVTLGFEGRMTRVISLLLSFLFQYSIIYVYLYRPAPARWHLLILAATINLVSLASVEILRYIVKLKYPVELIECRRVVFSPGWFYIGSVFVVKCAISWFACKQLYRVGRLKYPVSWKSIIVMIFLASVAASGL